MTERRFILYHKHSFSGRTLFLQLNGTVCQFDGLSTTSRIVESYVGGNQISEDVSNLLTNIEQRLELAGGTVEIDREFSVEIVDAQQSTRVYLARFTTVDVPYEQLTEWNGKFISLMDARRLPSTELELLRLAYSTIMDELVDDSL